MTDRVTEKEELSGLLGRRALRLQLATIRPDSVAISPGSPAPSSPSPLGQLRVRLTPSFALLDSGVVLFLSLQGLKRMLEYEATS